MAEVGSGRRTFGPVLLTGLAAGALTAVGASQTWFVARGDAAGLDVRVSVSGSDAAPLALAAALLALASWGVVLVSRSAGRRVASGIGLLAALGVLAVVIALWAGAEDAAADALADRGASSVEELGRRAWYWVTGLAAAVQVVALAAAFRLAPTWPTMSSRYDAPTPAATPASNPAATAPIEETETDELTLWKALDEGRDPTQR